jgi:DNA uptake protein ComE-like DNA-binding protein
MTRWLLVLVAGLIAATSWTSPDGLAQPKIGEALKKAVKEPLDLNTASEAELEGLPGIRKPLAKKIMDGRPFKSPEELVTKKILTQGVFDKLKHLVHVKP